jgi:hypothetical protein
MRVDREGGSWVFEHTPSSVGVLEDLKRMIMDGLKDGRSNIKNVRCQEVDVRRPGISIWIISVER